MYQLSELTLLPSYHKGEHDIAKDFYLPCMKSAILYDRAVAFFQSSVFVIAWPSLRGFVSRGGKIRLICSPFLSVHDVEALNEGYRGRANTALGERLRSQILGMLNDPYLKNPTRVIASLVAMEVIEIRIADVRGYDNLFRSRLFHDKVGIFKDAFGNTVVFKGSMNETWAGLALDGNLESVDVFVSWGDKREIGRVDNEVEYYNSLWQNKYEGVCLLDFPEAARKELINAADISRWPDLLDDIEKEIELSSQLNRSDWSSGRKPLPHQVEAIRSWIEKNRRGIFEHATGGGKTFTALLAIRDSIGRGEIPIVIVPSQVLLSQWRSEIRQSLQDLNVHILTCGAGNTKWREQALLKRWTRPGRQRRLVLTTVQTAATNDFLRFIQQGNHIFLVADEVHRLGSPKHREVLTIDSGPRLGLSATPRRAGDPEGTAVIFAYFEDVVPPPFSLNDAITSGFLTPYMYYVHPVNLTSAEQERWTEWSKKIAKAYAKHKRMDLSDQDIKETIKHMLISRAKITKSAEAKAVTALNIIKNEYNPGEKWIIYCDSQKQLYEVLRLLREAGIRAGEYHSAMSGNRDETLRHFEVNGGILVSIRCLDEGVNIPTVTHALVLASSKNPREFIQRRGRVLRRAPGKSISFVHDVLVLPNLLNFEVGSENENPPGFAILAGELSRAIIFGRAALNPSAIASIKKIAVEHDIDIDQLLEEGFEDDI